jgi:uncharacterized protein
LKPSLVIGASTNPERYSYKAIQSLVKHGFTTYAFAIKQGEVAGIVFQTEFIVLQNIDTVTLYIGAKHQAAFYNYIIGLQPKRVIFNPGTENPEFEELLLKNNIEAVEACTLVLLSIGNY